MARAKGRKVGGSNNLANGVALLIALNQLNNLCYKPDAFDTVINVHMFRPELNARSPNRTGYNADNCHSVILIFLASYLACNGAVVRASNS